jgi:hypothetical protein
MIKSSNMLGTQKMPPESVPGGEALRFWVALLDGTSQADQ